MTFDQLEQLVSIARYKTLTAAASQLHLSQPALSKNMQKLEAELDVPLFERSKNRTAFTESGLLAVQMAEKLLNMRLEMIQDVRNCYQKNSLIRLESVAPAPIWQIIWSSRKYNPDVQIQRDLECNERHLLDQLDRDDLDLIIVKSPVAREDLVCRRLFQESLYVELSKDHPLANQSPVCCDQLSGTSFLMIENSGFWYELTLKKFLNCHLLIQKERATLEEIANSSNIGRFKTNITLQAGSPKPHRVCIPVADPEFTVQYYVVYSKDKEEWLRPYLASLDQVNWKEAFMEYEE